MPTNSERPQRRMTTGTVISRALVEARETPQARRDPTVGNAEWMQAYQGGFKPLSGNFATGLPGGVPSPAQLSCMLMTETTIVDMSWDPISKLLFVGTAGDDVVEVWRQTGLYWERIDEIDPPDASVGLGFVSAYNGGLIVSFTQGQFYWPDWRDKLEFTKLRTPKAAALLANGLITDTVDDWPSKVTTSYQSETVPTGTYTGFHVDEASAIADGAVVGDWFYSTTSDNWQEITGVGPSANNLLQYSEEFDNAAWSKLNATVTPNQTEAPDGTLTADLWVPDAAADGRVQQQVTGGDGFYTGSYYAKANGLTQWFTHIVERNPTGQELQVAVDLNNQTVTYTSGSLNLIDSDVIAVGNGWYRVVITTEAVNGSADIELRPLSSMLGDGTQGVYIWGAQLTEGTLVPDQLVAGWNFNAGNRRVFLDQFDEKATRLLNDTFTSSNRVFTDNFNRPAVGDWTTKFSVDSAIAITNQRLRNTLTTGGPSATFSTYAYPFKENTWYRIRADYVDGTTVTGSAEIQVFDTTEATIVQGGTVTSFGSTMEVQFLSGAGASKAVDFALRRNSANDGAFTEWDNVVVEELGALEGWVPAQGASLGISNFQLQITNDDTGANVGVARKNVSTSAVIGRAYKFTGTYTGVATGRIKVGNTIGGQEYADLTSIPSGETVTTTFVATSANVWIDCDTNNVGAGAAREYDNIVLDELPAPSQWSDVSTGTGYVFAENGQCGLYREDVSNTGAIEREFTGLTVGNWYTIRYDYLSGVGSSICLVGTASNSSDYLNLAEPLGLVEGTFQATTTNAFVRIRPGSNTTTHLIDDFYFEEVPALEDWRPISGAEPSIISNAMGMENGTANFGHMVRNIDLDENTLYIATADGFSNQVNGIIFAAGSDDNTRDLAEQTEAGTGAKTFSITFNGASGVLTKIQCWHNTNVQGDTSTWDNIAISTAKSVIPEYSATTDADAATQIFRAGSANFPEAFVIDATVSDVVIYEINDGVPTMWMVFVGGSNNMARGEGANPNTSLSYSDGELQIGTAGSGRGIQRVLFASDQGVRHVTGSSGLYLGDISQRNDGLGHATDGTATIVSTVVNDVSSTVLSTVDTTNLALQTEDLTQWSNLSLTLTETDPPPGVNLAYHLDKAGVGAFDRVELLTPGYTPITLDEQWVYSAYVRDTANNDFAIRLEDRNGTGNTVTLQYRFVDGVPVFLAAPTSTLASYDTSYFTDVGEGWWRIAAVIKAQVTMTGDLGQIAYPVFNSTTPAMLEITGFQLEQSSTPHNYVPNTGNPIDPPTLNAGFNEPNNTVFEDTFNRTDPAPWNEFGFTTLSIKSGQLAVTNDFGLDSATETSVAYPFVEGQWYRISANPTLNTANGGLRLFTNPTDTSVADFFPSANNFIEWYVRAPANANYLVLRDGVTPNAGDALWDNVQIEEVLALNDWIAVVADTGLEIDNEQLLVRNSTGATAVTAAQITYDTIPGRTYRFSALRVAGDSDGRVDTYTTSGNLIANGNDVTTGTSTVDFIAQGEQTRLRLRDAAIPNGDFGRWDNAVLELTEDGIGKTPPGKQLRNRTNRLSASNDFIDAAWAKEFGGTGSAPIVTAGFQAPDGSNTATRLQVDRGVSGTATDRSFIQQLETAQTTTKTASIWIRSNDGTSPILYFRTGAENYITVTPEWERYEVTAAPDSTVSYFTVGLRTAQSSQSADLLVWQAQLEEEAYATPYIDTTADERYGLFDGGSGYLKTATVPDNVLRVEADILPDTWNAAGSEHIVAQYGTNAAQRSWAMRFSGLGPSISAVFSDDGTAFEIRTSANVPFADGQRGWIAFEYDQNNNRLLWETSTDGENWTQLGDATTTTIGTLFKSTARLSVGMRADPQADFYNGRVYEARVYQNATLVEKFDPNDYAQGWSTHGTPAITSDSTAITVTDDYGLFVPDWAVATDGGLSNGRDDGNVWDITGQSNQLFVTGYTQNEQIVYGEIVASVIALYDPLEADVAFTAFASRYYSTANLASEPTAPKILNDDGGRITSMATEGPTLAFTDGQEGLSLIDEDTTDYLKGQYTHVTDGYNTGPMFEPLGAWANQATVSGGPGPGPSPGPTEPILLDTEFTAGSFATGGFRGYANPVTTRSFGTIVDDTYTGGEIQAAIQTQTGNSLTEFAIQPNGTPQNFYWRYQVDGITDPNWNGGSLVYFSYDDQLVQYVAFSGAQYWTFPLSTQFVDGDTYRLRVYAAPLDTVYYGQMTAALSGSATGFDRNLGGGLGKINPTVEPGGLNDIRRCYTDGTVLWFAIQNLTLPQTYFDDLKVTGISDPNWNGSGVTLNQADASFTQADGATFWSWPKPTDFVDGDVYQIEATEGP